MNISTDIVCLENLTKDLEEIFNICCSKCGNVNLNVIEVFPDSEEFVHPINHNTYKYLTFKYFCKECGNVFKPLVVAFDEMIIIENICRKVLLYEITGNKTY